LLVIASFVGRLAALVVRYRRSSSHDRRQLRWIAFGGAVFLSVYLVSLLLDIPLGDNTTPATVNTFISQLAFAALPVSIGYAVLSTVSTTSTPWSTGRSSTAP
jgi:nucleoside permease NupC